MESTAPSPDGCARRGHIDVVALKQRHPIAEVVARYGIELRPVGRALVGRCPLHDDQGRPNLFVYPDTDSWFCYRCDIGGDCIRFVEEIEHVDFLDAVARLAGQPDGTRLGTRRAAHTWRLAPRVRQRLAPDDASHQPALPPAEERACLAAAVELYTNRLLSDSTALAYVRGRGLDQATVERYRLGYAAGDELAEYLRWRRLPVAAARRAGLLARGGREFLAGRIVVPALLNGEPIWAVGRVLGETAGEDQPKYLGLPGRKALLGWDDVCALDAVCVVEGVFDWLALCVWGVPAAALVGTHASHEMRVDLARFARLYLVLDNDEAGRSAAADLAQAFGSRAVPVTLPVLPGVKDVADLAVRPDGRAVFARAIADALQGGGSGDRVLAAPPANDLISQIAA